MHILPEILFNIQSGNSFAKLWIISYKGAFFWKIICTITATYVRISSHSYTVREDILCIRVMLNFSEYIISNRVITAYYYFIKYVKLYPTKIWNGSEYGTFVSFKPLQKCLPLSFCCFFYCGILRFSLSLSVHNSAFLLNVAVSLLFPIYPTLLS